MDLSTALGIIGLAATVVLGLLGIAVAMNRRDPGELTFILERTIFLFKDIVKGMPQLTVLYKNESVTETLILIRGTLVNTGHIDVTEGSVKRPLEALLPKGSRWRESTVVDTSPDLKVRLDIATNALVFNLGLFRRDEYVRLELLLELPEAELRNLSSSDTLLRAIEFQHRIANTRRVVAVPGPRYYEGMPGIGSGLFATGMMAVLLVLTQRGFVPIPLPGPITNSMLVGMVLLVFLVTTLRPLLRLPTTMRLRRLHKLLKSSKARSSRHAA